MEERNKAIRVKRQMESEKALAQWRELKTASNLPSQSSLDPDQQLQQKEQRKAFLRKQRELLVKCT